MFNWSRIPIIISLIVNITQSDYLALTFKTHSNESSSAGFGGRFLEYERDVRTENEIESANTAFPENQR